MKWQSELGLAVRAAEDAGALLRKAMGTHKAILSDTGRDIKLQADRDSEDVILLALKQSEYPVLAEESGECGIIEGDAPFWVVDPLDGTLNFSRGIPLSCISIGLCQGNEPLLGVVYDFNHGECFRGVAGGGAWCGDEPISVSKVARKQDAILATGFPVNRDFASGALEDFMRKVQGFKKTRLLGSAALSLAYVACGRVDAYSEEDIMYWDVAAGVALVKAAGGSVTLRDSGRVKWGKRLYCAASAGVWE